MNNSYLSPYLTFNGNCEEAMQFYKDVFGGELEINRFGDFAEAGMRVAEENKSKVMHSTLKHDMVSFMASDGAPDHPPVIGNNVSLSLAGKSGDKETLTEYFNKLAEGGAVTVPLALQVWGDTFGMVIDRFGINWMFNIGHTQPGTENGEA